MEMGLKSFGPLWISYVVSKEKADVELDQRIKQISVLAGGLMSTSTRARFPAGIPLISFISHVTDPAR